MPDLRQALGELGFEGVRTYVQSGNIVLAGDLDRTALAGRIEALLADRFGLPDVPVIVRSVLEMAAVVERNPFGDLANDHKRLQVSFLSDRLAPAVGAVLAEASIEPEAVHVDALQIYGWYPGGIQTSKLARLLTDKRLGVIATARNWTTVTTLLSMAEELSAR